MMDFTATLAPYIYESIEHERDIEANKRRWNARLKELMAADRIKAQAAKTLGRRTVASHGAR